MRCLLAVVCSFFLVAASAITLQQKIPSRALRRVALHGRLQDGFLGQVRENAPIAFDGTNPNVTTAWFTQKVDNFDTTNALTWKQYYWQNNAHYTPGGPIFVLIGGEGPTSQDWIDDSHVQMTYLKFAQYYGAMAFQLEHRCYGQSSPTPDSSTPNLRYCNSRQALADLAAFIQGMNQQYGWTGAKWVTFGGSYSGALSAWFKEKYPQMIVGAVGSSAPVQTQVDFRDYFVVVRDSFNAYNPDCNRAIQQGTDYITTLLGTPAGQAMVKAKLKFCADINWILPKNVQNFWSIIFGNYQITVQYSQDNRGVFADKVTIPKVCNMMTDSKVPDYLDRFAAVNNLLMDAFGQSCIDVDYQDTISQLQQTAWISPNAPARLWIWQTCTEFGYFQDTDAPGLPFENKIPLSFYQAMCADIFGAQFTPSYIQSLVDATTAYYGGRSNYSGMNVCLPNGSVDPWHALGLLSPPNPYVTTLYIYGTAHCSDMYPARKEDTHGLILARESIDLSVARWIR